MAETEGNLQGMIESILFVAGEAVAKAEEVVEEKVELPKSENLTTSLSSLLKGLKLD